MKMSLNPMKRCHAKLEVSDNIEKVIFANPFLNKILFDCIFQMLL